MNEAATLWKGVVSTLRQRGLLRDHMPVADGIVLPDRVVFLLDMQRLGGIPREAWLDRRLHRQIRAALGGRPVVVSDSYGLAIQVGRLPVSPAPLPRQVSLDLSHRTTGMPYPVPLGVGRRGPLWVGLPDLGHILVGGTTRTGKTMWIQSVLSALTATHTPDDLRIAIVDPKEVDFAGWRGKAHVIDVAGSPEDAGRLVGEILNEAEGRQKQFATVGATNLLAYRRMAGNLPLIVLVVDEFIDLAVLAGSRSPFYRSLLRLASKGAGLGIYLILSATNPKSEVINTLIRANCSTRIAFRCAERRQSEAILEAPGAEKLPPIPGRALVRLPGSQRLIEVQGYHVESPKPLELALTEDERELVRYAAEHLSGRFPVNQIAKAFQGKVSAWRIRLLAQDWERRGWLTHPRHATDARRITDELRRLAGLTGSQGSQASQGS